MATIKSYTDLEQSKKLAEILPLESADMVFISYTNLKTNTVEYDYPSVNIDGIEELDIPCWSLAALIEILPNIIVIDGFRWGLSIRKSSISYLGSMTWDGQLTISVKGDNLVDACYEMIIKLNEQNLLVK